MNIDFTSNSLRFGYGCFETIKVINTKILNFDKHLERLNLACQTLLLNHRCINEKKTEIIEFCDEHCLQGTWVLRLIVTPQQFQYFLEPYTELDKSLKYKLCLESEWRIDSTSPLNKFKSFNYLGKYIPYQKAVHQGFFDVLFVNEKEEIVETSKANIFFQDSAGDWFTPPLSSGCLAGIIRGHVIQELAVKEQIIKKEHLWKFKKFILTNSLIDKLEIAEIV